MKSYTEIKEIMGVPEEWREVDLDPNVIVSNYGRVKRRLSPNGKYKLAKNEARDRDGYKRITICGKSYREHIIILNSFVPKPFEDAVVDHINGVKDDNYISNLRWVTVQENTRFAGEMGLLARDFKSIVIIVDKDDVGTMYSTVTDLAKDFPNLRAEDVYNYFSGKRKSLKGYKAIRMNELNDKRRVKGGNLQSN